MTRRQERSFKAFENLDAVVDFVVSEKTAVQILAIDLGTGKKYPPQVLLLMLSPLPDGQIQYHARRLPDGALFDEIPETTDKIKWLLGQQDKLSHSFDLGHVEVFASLSSAPGAV